MQIKTLRRMALLLALVMLSCTLMACGSSAPLHADLDFTSVDPASCTETDNVTDYVKLTVKDYGDIYIRLFPEVAPISVKNFQSLVADGFYDGVIFHRVVKDFVIQAGEPVDGNEEKYPTIKGEFQLNDVTNNLRHIRGVVSMARTAIDYNSASTQFFIVQKSNSDLNYGYAGFGYVACGMDVVDAIAGVAVSSSDPEHENKPVTDVVIEKACFVTVTK
jgi:peptidyl-prolyl cis-trans isomerase B (cyclophilin B)